MASCQIYMTSEAFFVLTQHETVEGFYVTTGPMMKLDRGGDDELLGRLALLALSRSVEGMEAPSEPQGVTRTLVRFVGPGSWKKFARGSHLVLVESRGDESVLVPYRCLDASFEPVEERSVTRAPIAAEIGATAREVLGSLEVAED